MCLDVNGLLGAILGNSLGELLHSQCRRSSTARSVWTVATGSDDSHAIRPRCTGGSVGGRHGESPSPLSTITADRDAAPSRGDVARHPGRAETRITCQPPHRARPPPGRQTPLSPSPPEAFEVARPGSSRRAPAG